MDKYEGRKKLRKDNRICDIKSRRSQNISYQDDAFIPLKVNVWKVSFPRQKSAREGVRRRLKDANSPSQTETFIESYGCSERKLTLPKPN